MSQSIKFLVKGVFKNKGEQNNVPFVIHTMKSVVVVMVPLVKLKYIIVC